MKAIRIGAAAITMVSLCIAPALAGAFDGNWTGRVLPKDGCAAGSVSSLVLTVRGEEITGVLRNLRNRVAVTGTVDAQGKGSVHVARDSGTVTFSGDKFAMDWEGQRGCNRHADGTREAASGN